MFYKIIFEKIIWVNNMNLGVILRKIREEEGLTQEEVAKKLGINRVQYNQYENDYFNIPIKYLIAIADFYQISIDFLFNNFSTIRYNSFNIVKNDIAGSRLKEFRKEHKLTQEKLAEILNTTHSNIGFYEKGRNLIATPFLYQICHQYHVSADYLLGRIDKNPQENKT